MEKQSRFQKRTNIIKIKDTGKPNKIIEKNRVFQIELIKPYTHPLFEVSR